ncbi:MAG: arylesterase [Verrucomicrobia bacterium]|nr:arylesterase [Verrucomicrobiota bacterium]
MRERVRQFLSATMAAAIFLSAQAAPARDTSGVKRVLVLGDSLSEGFRLNPRDAWPSLVAPRLRAVDPQFEVVNASVSGSTTAGGLRRLPSYLNRPVAIFLLELGINDAFRGVSVAEIEENLQTIIDKVRAKNSSAVIVVIGMQFPIEGAADDYVVAFGKMFGELAERNHAALVPYLLAGVGGDPTLNLDDRIHPNAAGHKALAENVWRVLEPVAREVAARAQP